MSLQLLTEGTTLALYHDTENGWLYADWQGELTLPTVQENCLTIAQYFLQGDYRQVLNDNTNVVSVSADISPWLASEYLPYIVLGDVDHIAWVYSPILSAQCYTDLAVYALNSPVVALFSDMDAACSWLKSARFRHPTSADDQGPNMERLARLLQSRHDTASLIEVMGTRGIHLYPTENL
ncbi:hypothetical protein [Hymenobacter weizhouensis]|uniref:hypothetical protein n=1 Tax=Hymenobacter sp. YIM 151500-1 TaxID=2987689 RepID=UPI0022276187|nr:hypothetical protein [Hymenobacter sp. YIM 151500-1]UYZ64758.1 hypothetical protein OIS53_07885 [Hymenobacter sp. YIM 151500-1]